MSSRRKLARPVTSRLHSFESLESRQMMAGNLTANLTGNTLFINEAPGSLGFDQSVQVTQLPSSLIKVEGLFNKSGGQTLINGATSVEFGHPLHLVMGLGGGNDQIQVRNATFFNVQILAGDPSGTNFVDDDEVVLSNVNTSSLVDIRMGGGRDNVFIQACNIGGDLKINTGVTGLVGSFDQDGVFIQNTRTHAATIITTGASGDLLRITDSNLGDDTKDFLQIETGAGADTVEIVPNHNFQTVKGNIVITTFDSESEKDVDTVRIQQVACESILVQLGDGGDNVDMLGVTAGRTIQLEGMRGNDTMKLTEVEALDAFFALMGDDNDRLDLTFVKARNTMKLDGGSGFDTLERHQMPFNPNLSVKNWEVINGKRQFNVSPNAVLTKSP